MSQKQSSKKLVESLLSTIDPKLIADNSWRQTVERLLNLIEELNSKVIKLEAENQSLKDENNRLKGEKGQPDIKAKKPRGLSKNYSSEKERKTRNKNSKSRKNESINIDREEILEPTFRRKKRESQSINLKAEHTVLNSPYKTNLVDFSLFSLIFCDRKKSNRDLAKRGATRSRIIIILSYQRDRKK